MNCQHIEELLPLLLDGDDAGLNEFERDAVLLHVQSCPLCQEEQRLLQETVAALSYLEELEPPQELRQRIRARVESYERRSFRGFWRRFGIQLSPNFARNLAVATASIAVLVTSAAVLTTMSNRPLMESDLRRSEQARESGALSTGNSRPASPSPYGDLAKADRVSTEPGFEAPEPESAPKPSAMQPLAQATVPPQSVPEPVAQDDRVAQNEEMPPRIELKARAKDESRREGAKKPKPGDLDRLDSKNKPVLSADVYEPESTPAAAVPAAPQSTTDEPLESLGYAGSAQEQDAKKGAPQAADELAEKELLDDSETQAGAGAGAAGTVSRKGEETSSTSEERQNKLQKQADPNLDAAAAQATAIAGSTPFYEEAAATRWLPLSEPAGRRDKSKYAQSTDPSQVPSRDVSGSDVEASVPPALVKELAALQPAVTGGPDPVLEIGFDRRGRPRYLRWARELPAGQVALLNEIGARYSLTLVPPGDAKPTAGPASKVASTEKY